MKIARALLALPALLFVAAGLSTAAAKDHEHPEIGFRHIVCFEFKDSATPEDIQEIVEQFAALEEKIDAVVDIEWGPAENVEPLNGDFTHCFLVSFEDKAGLETYLPHPDHKAFVKLLKPHLAEVFVFDYTPQG